MGQYSSYYTYQKFEKRGSQDWIPCYPNVYSISGDSQNPMPLSVKSECDVNCGCQSTIYQWVDLDPSVDYYCDECPASDYTFTWKNGSETLTRYGDRGTSGGAYLYLISKQGSSNVGFSIESMEGWEGVTDPRYIPSTGSSSSGTYLLASHPINSSGSDKQYSVTLKQNESGNRIYLFMTVQGMGGNEGFFFENMTATTINPIFERDYPSTGYSAFIISHYNNANTSFTASSDAAWLKVVIDGYVTANDYWKIHYYPSGSTQQERTATITLTQQGSGEKLYIIATQRGTGCTTASTTCYSSTSNISANEVAGTATTNTVRWDWDGTKTTRTTACTSADTAVSGSSSTTVTFDTNYGDSARTVSGTVQWNVKNCDGSTSGLSIPYSFVQRRACHPTTSYCYTSISNVSAEAAPAAATANTITWDYVGTRIVTNVECEQTETPITGSSSAEVTMPMNTANTDVTVEGTYNWYVTKCDGTSGGIPVPYSFTHKKNEGNVYITWSSQLSDIITISRLIITFQGSTTRHYFNANSGPIYSGSIRHSIIWVDWSTSRKMSSMEAEYTMTGQSGTRTKYVKLPQSSTYGTNPTFNFSSQYFQGGLEANFTITP